MSKDLEISKPKNMASINKTKQKKYNVQSIRKSIRTVCLRVKTKNSKPKVQTNIKEHTLVKRCLETLSLKVLFETKVGFCKELTMCMSVVG